MTLAVFCSYMDVAIAEGQDPKREGYLVEYPLVGEDDKPNHPQHEGYISWSPKEAFEAAYVPHPGNADLYHLAQIMEKNETAFTPRTREFCVPHLEALVGVGKDHTASVVMCEETLKVLRGMDVNKANFNPDTVGTAVPQVEQYPEQRHVTFGQAIEHLRKGLPISREGWNGKGMYVFKQVPSKVPAEVVPKMSSLPEAVKDRMMVDGIAPDYQNQMAIVKPDGSIDSWIASSADTFATDWILLTP